MFYSAKEGCTKTPTYNPWVQVHERKRICTYSQGKESGRDCVPPTPGSPAAPGRTRVALRKPELASRSAR